MSRMWAGMGSLFTLLATLAGCASPEPNLKPPLHEEYAIPPTDDSRFSSPIQFPKETLNNNGFKKQNGEPGDRFKGPGSGSSGPTFGAGS